MQFRVVGRQSKDPLTDFCLSTWLEMLTAWLNVAAKRDGSAVPTLPALPAAQRQLATLPRVSAKNQKYPYKLPVSKSTSSVGQSLA